MRQPEERPWFPSSAWLVSNARSAGRRSPRAHSTRCTAGSPLRLDRCSSCRAPASTASVGTQATGPLGGNQ